MRLPFFEKSHRPPFADSYLYELMSTYVRVVGFLLLDANSVTAFGLWSAGPRGAFRMERMRMEPLLIAVAKRACGAVQM